VFSKETHSLRACDPDLRSVIQQEHRRQEQLIEFIPSENYTSAAVMSTQSSQPTNK
jgi:glycine/serine hydroxymethyltransferase